MTESDPERQLMIKTKACQRLIKEVAYYEKEVQENEAKLRKMKEEEDKDAYDVKKFTEVLGESQMMIPDSKARLQQMLEDLAVAVEASDSSSEWYTTAQTLLKEQNVTFQDDVQETTVGEGDEQAF